MSRSKRLTAAVLAGILTGMSTISGYAAASQPACDETMYLVIGDQGEIQESSVVKRYEIARDGEIRDYGVYVSVANLTTEAEAQQHDDGSISFPVLAEDKTFYFEGKTQTEWKDLPWNIQIRYLLNGVETDPQKLYGQKGLVEIEVDLIPNSQLPDFYKNNMALTMAAMVDRDDVLSFRAEGAQLQTLGNKSVALFFALPGEECHDTIAIGSDSFSFGGLVFLMVPLTMGQLEHVADIREAKETLEDSADALSDSMDVLLDTMEQMRGGLSQTANGLRSLDHARSVISASKGSVYEKADRALDDLDALSVSLEPFQKHTETAQALLNDLRINLDDLFDDVGDLEARLGDLRDTVGYLRDDFEEMQSLASGAQTQAASFAFQKLLEKTRQDLDGLGASQKELSQSMKNLQKLLMQMQAGGSQLAEQAEILRALDLDTDYDPEELEELIAELEIPLENDLEPTASVRTYVKSSASNCTLPPESMPVLGKLLGSATEFTGSSGVASDLAAMIGLSQQVLTMVSGEEKLWQGTAQESDDFMRNIGKICQEAEDICSDLDHINQTMGEYHPELLKTLQNMGEMTERASAGLSSLGSFLRGLKEQIQSAGGSLDAGTQAALTGLADVLDRADSGLAQTETLRNAKNTVKTTIEDKWDEFSAEKTTILELDPEAEFLSLTSEKNPSPRSIQIVLRTQEITEPDEEEDTEIDESYHPEGSIFHRIMLIFRKIWDTICGLF